MEEFILKIGKDTNHIKAAKAIAANITQGKKVYIDVIGASANYIAAKAFIEVCTGSTLPGINISFFPTYKDIKTSMGDVKTAIRWKIIIL